MCHAKVIQFNTRYKMIDYKYKTIETLFDIYCIFFFLEIKDMHRLIIKPMIINTCSNGHVMLSWTKLIMKNTMTTLTNVINRFFIFIVFAPLYE